MIVFVLVEVVALLAIHRLTGRGIAPWSLLVNIGAGGSLMLALRVVFADGHRTAIAACLIASLVFHVLDLVNRWQRDPAAS